MTRRPLVITGVLAGAALALSLHLMPAPSTSLPPPSAAPEAPVTPQTPAAPPTPESQSQTSRHALSLEIAAAARHYVAQAPVGFRADCSGFIEAILSRVDKPVYGSVAMMFEAAEKLDAVHHRPEPTIGDLAFFHNTYDRNKNGKQDDLYSHIAVVVDVEPDGTILLAHHGSKRTLIWMNLQPETINTKEDPQGKTLNSVLKYRYDAPFNWPLRLTSQNWAAFATVRPEDDWPGQLPRP